MRVPRMVVVFVIADFTDHATTDSIKVQVFGPRFIRASVLYSLRAPLHVTPIVISHVNW